jgi:molecular chaperone DnaK
MPWILAIDFGTTFTVGAVAEGGRTTLIDPEGNGSPTMPSAVWRNDDGILLVGSEAFNQAVFAPERFEPTPKRRIGQDEILLGDQFVPIIEVIGAVIARVAGEAIRQHGGEPPDELRLTHPAAWATSRLGVLEAAAKRAGLPDPSLMPEPVAAALGIVANQVKVGRHVAIYDFGGGTFDAAVVRRTDDGYEVAGPVGGRDPLGGENIDQLILEYMDRELPIGKDPLWSQLMEPSDQAWRRARADLRSEIRRAKEGLSNQLSRKLWVPGIQRAQQLTRAELEGLIRAEIDQTVQILKDTIVAAECDPKDLDGVYLVGGSSRIPLVADVIWRELKLRPEVSGNPKAVVVQGAAGWHDAAPPPRPVPPEPTAPGREFRSRLAMATVSALQSGPTECFTTFELSAGELAVWIDDAPAGASSTADLAERAGARWAQAPGYRERSIRPANVLGIDSGLERQLIADDGDVSLSWIERYLVSDGRALVVTAHEQARSVAESLRVRPRTLDPRKNFEPSFAISVPEGWSIVDRLELMRTDTGRSVVVESHALPKSGTAKDWASAEAQVRAHAIGARLEGPSSEKVLGRAGGSVFTLATDDGTVTRLWFCGIGDRGYVISATVPIVERFGLKLLASQVKLANPAGTGEE